MRIAVISCSKYADCWPAFFGLFRKFWPDCPYPVTLVTDGFAGPFKGEYFCSEGNWCQILNRFAASGDDEVLLLQEDFLLNAPVRQDLVAYGLGQLKARAAGLVRLYPCPGANEDYGDPHFGKVKPWTEYRVSCQASIWNARYLQTITGQCTTPWDFEIRGSRISSALAREVLAFKRDSGPWPLEYICSAISRAKWNPDAKILCDREGITVDWSLRDFAPA